MKFALASCVAGIALVAGSAGAETLLSADFNDKTVDAPAETGGAEANEPYSVSAAVTGMIVEGPGGSPALQIQDNHESTAGWAEFRFLGSGEVNEGLVTMQADLYFADSESFTVSVRESGGFSRSFLTYRFSNGSMTATDAAGSMSGLGTYTLNEWHTITLLFDMDARTYDVLVDDVLTVDDRAHGIDDRGVGSMLVVCSHDADLDGTVYVDNVSAELTGGVPVTNTSWSQIRQQYRN